MKIVYTIILFIPLLTSFFLINQDNFKFRQEVQASLVEHPERLPKAEYAELLFPGFSNVTANIYWLQAIQYIGRNALASEYRKYLAEMMNLITELNPYFESPYVIGQLLLPSDWNQMHENFSQEEMQAWTQKAKELWHKWVRNFCDEEKLELIFAEENLARIIEDEIYKNPCQSFKIPYHLAYIYFFYLKDYRVAANYYKVVSAQSDAPIWARNLAAIMQWRSGQRETSLYMFLTLAQSTQDENEVCSLLSRDIENVHNTITHLGLPLEWKLIAEIQALRDTLFPEEEEEDLLSGPQCSDHLKRAIRELSLLYLNQADERFRADYPEEESAQNPERLFELWYIDFIPTDFQRYDDYGIVYRFNSEIWGFDFEMSY
jgi:hypothetical protein